MKFIGVDLAWSPMRKSGLACLRDADGKPTVEHLEHAQTDAEILRRILHWRDRSLATIAVDAPLIVENLSGARPCDRLVSARYHRYDAGCYPANLSLLAKNRQGIVRPVVFASRLRGHGFRDYLGASRPGSQNTFFETYPHAAFVSIFQRDRIHKYKRTPPAQKERALLEWFEYLNQIIGFDEAPRASLRGALASKRWKKAEDMLDAALCAYMAFLAATQTKRARIFGDRSSGYIVLPLDRRIE